MSESQAEPAELFSELPEPIRAGIRDLGWSTPMPVQAKTIPLMREGLDLIVQARTGSGKTGAFGIPIVECIDPELAATQALVMLPTRELANQVAEEIGAIAKHMEVRCLPIYGGVGYGAQLEGLERGAHVVVGTPGRLLDHLGNGRLKLDQVRVVVFDEADEMLSLGFWPDMREIKSYLPKQLRSYLFSATIPEKVRSLSRFFLRDPQFVTLSEGQVAPAEIEHFFYVCTAQEKEANLLRIIEYEDPESAIIFCNTKADVRYVTSYLQKRKLDADMISGDLNQAAREQAIKKIKAGKLRFLVATDVAARGLDISDLSHVISFAAPESPEVYVHRTGRTGRAGKAGIALSLVSGLDIGNFRQLQNVNKITILERKIPTDTQMLDRIRERLQVKVEQEMRAVSETERREGIDRLIPVVDALAKTDPGRRELAAICSAYLREHRPETTVPAEEVEAAASQTQAADPDEDRGASDGRSRGRHSRGPGSGRRSGSGGRSRRPRRR